MRRRGARTDRHRDGHRRRERGRRHVRGSVPPREVLTQGERTSVFSCGGASSFAQLPTAVHLAAPEHATPDNRLKPVPGFALGTTVKSCPCVVSTNVEEP